MIAASVFVLITQNPHQYLVVLFMSIFREGDQSNHFVLTIPAL